MKQILLSLALSAACTSLHALDLSAHPFFKHLIGEWKAEGELKGQDGNNVTITESWTGKADAEDSFFIEGTRTLNGDTQPFKWTIIHNPATDAYEAELSGGDSGQSIRFEGSFSEVEMVMRMKAITGSGEGSISLEDSFTDETKETLVTNVTFTGDQGQTTLQGKITHKKAKGA